jgi:hypothetical protein
MGTRLAELMSKDMQAVRAAAMSSGADLGLIGDVLSSDVVQRQVLGAGTPPSRALAALSKAAPRPMKEGRPATNPPQPGVTFS